MREARMAVDGSDLDSIGLGSFFALSREARVQEVDELACHGDGGLIQVAVGERYDEAALSELETVDQWEYVGEAEEGHLYLVEITAREIPDRLTEAYDDLVGDCQPAVDDDGVSVSLVGDQETIAGAIGEYEETGASPDLRKLGAYDGRTHLLDGLTDRQQEVLRTAYEMGYYDVPREVSTEEVAAELDLDPSTVAEHLQRAERNVFSQLL
jgi:DNA-binding CsgD family transcriptional regulator